MRSMQAFSMFSFLARSKVLFSETQRKRLLRRLTSMNTEKSQFPRIGQVHGHILD